MIKSRKKVNSKNYCKKRSHNKSHKKKSRAVLHAGAVLHANADNITGNIKFIQKGSKTSINYHINGLSDGEHGFHIHKNGDLSDGCASACEHFNPFRKKHGGLNSKHHHAGDLGNIISSNGLSKGIIYSKDISLRPCDINSILGRMIIIHEDPDDLGKGENEESLKTGNAGKRVACGVIGIVE